MGKPRCTRIEYLERLDKLWELNRLGYTRAKMVQYGREQWGLSERAIDKYRTALFKTLKQELKLNRQEKTSQIIDQLSHVYEKSLAQGQYSSAVGALNTQSRILKLEE